MEVEVVVMVVIVDVVMVVIMVEVVVALAHFTNPLLHSAISDGKFVMH